jgi:nitrate/nitrite-specific signal transduction histidine kinase
MVLHVIDNGVGLSDDRKLKQGLGLHIMNYRARLAGGRLEIDSPQTGGTRVSCYLPVQTQRPKKAPNGEEPIGAMPKLSRVPVASDRTL